MRNVRIILAVMLATAAINSSHAAVGAPAAEDETKRLNTCMAMSPDALAADTDCTDLMKRKNITAADMQAMKTCKAMKADTMAGDETCTAMSDKHPDVMKPKLQ